MKWWWLSYSGDAGFRGLVILEAANFLEACAEARRLKISPGGSVRGLELEVVPDVALLKSYSGRCLSQVEADELSLKMAEAEQ